MNQSSTSTMTFCEHKRSLAFSFQQIEDSIIAACFRETNSRNDIAQVRLEIQEKLVLLYQRVIDVLAMYDGERSLSLKEKNENETLDNAKQKQQPGNIELINKANEIIDVHNSTGMDFLENRLVRCKACYFEWDGDAQHECVKDEDVDEVDII